MSFFDDGEETASRPSSSSAAREQRPRPRRPQHGGSPALDQHTLAVRRGIAAAIGIVLLLVIIVVVSGCLKSRQQQALKDYNREVGHIVEESDQQVSHPFFSTLSDAAGKSALNVGVQIDQLRIQAQSQASHAAGLSVPSSMTSAQRNLLLALDLRVEGLTKLTPLVRTALGGQIKQASVQIAGDMEVFLASDVVYSQRVAPLIQRALAAGGVQGLSTAPTRFLPNLGWLEPTTALANITGQAAGGSSAGQIAPGTHGHSLVGVSVGASALQPEPTLNHLGASASPTFTVDVENAGSNPETNVKVDITITAGGKQFKASHAIDTTQPGSKTNVDIPVTGVPAGVASKIEVNIEAVPGETDVENNKGTFLAIFG